MALLWFGGIALRVTVLAVPPLLPRIHHDLALSETSVGALSSLPVLLLAAASVFGSLLIARAGPRRAIIGGLFLIAVAGAARGAGTSTPVIFLMTFLMGIGIAVSQPALPSLARLWFPTRTALATAVYSNGFLIGEVAGAAFTVSVVLPLTGGSWQASLVFWSALVFLIGIAFSLLTSHTLRDPDAPTMRWWPDWRSTNTWRLGLILGGASLAYFATNAFIPDYLRATHHPQYIGAALTSLNVSQLPTTLIAALMPRYVIARRWPVVAAGFLTVGAAAAMAMGGVWVVVWAAPLGFATALVFVLALALPPLLTDPHDVHRLSAAMFTISYSCSFAGSLVAGAIWDSTGVPLSSFAPIVGAGLAVAAIVLGTDLSAARRRYETASVTQVD
jgi:CP family cyanate transporter-like MFS transporter